MHSTFTQIRSWRIDRKMKVRWASCFGSCVDDNQRGFTLVELIMTMVIVGILAVVVAPHFFDNSAFQARGFADQVQASLRYAQKVAIARHRYVCVTFTPNSITLTINAVPVCPGVAMAAPSGGATYGITAPSGIVFTATPADFYFDALGKPSFVTAQNMTVSGYSTAITVEAETGYVHSP